MTTVDDEEALADLDRLLAEGRIADAARQADSLRQAGHASPIVLNLCSWLREEKGQFDEAAALLIEALQLAPQDPLIHAALAGVNRKMQNLRAALHWADQAIAIDPRCAPAWLERAFAFDAGGSIRAARDSFQRAAFLDPGAAPAWGGLSYAEARLGEFPASRAAADRALTLNPIEPLGVFGFARAALDRGDSAAAVSRLEDLLAANPGPDNRQIAFALLGDARADLRQWDGAFAAYSAANDAFAEHHPRRPPESQTQFVHRLETALIAAGPERWLRPQPARTSVAVPRHVFVLGFPRSGTTLMENILASLPGAHALEERPTMEAADRDFLLSSDGMKALGQLSEAELDRYRTAYWNAVFAAGVPRNAALLIDMDPMKSLRLPLIARLFPDANIVFMRRDPRDVVWSCFRTAFAPSSAAFEFTSLERTARLYDAVMRFIETSKALLPLCLHEVRYEQLVVNFEAGTRRLCAALGVPWSDALLRFDRTAERRGVSTASVGQVRRGLYDGSGQWRPFEAYLRPVLPILEPWL